MLGFMTRTVRARTARVLDEWDGSAGRGRLSVEAVVERSGVDVEGRQQLGVGVGVDLLAELAVRALGGIEVAASPQLLDDHRLRHQHQRTAFAFRNPVMSRLTSPAASMCGEWPAPSITSAPSPGAI